MPGHNATLRLSLDENPKECQGLGAMADVQVPSGAHAGSSIDEQVESCIKLASYDWLTLLPGMLNVLCIMQLSHAS